jgi:hypothetical protein
MMSDDIKDDIEENMRKSDNLLFYAHKGLIKFGGSFAKALGELILCADYFNKGKIYVIWIEELVEHACLYVTWAEKHRPDLLHPGYEMYLSRRKVSDE